MSNIKNICTGSRIKHKAFGEGIVVQTNERFSTVVFHDGETRRFMTETLFSMGFAVAEQEAQDDVKIVNIKVEELFGYIDYDIGINVNNNVSILTAPNGCGKTTIFKLLDFVFNPDASTFGAIKAIPFKRFICELDNGKVISLYREKISLPSNCSDSDQANLRYKIALSYLGSDYDFIFEITGVSSRKQAISFTEEFVKDRENRAMHGYYDDDDSDPYRYGQKMAASRENRFYSRIRVDLKESHCKANLDFIVANRLQKAYDPQLAFSSSDVDYERGRRRDQEKVDFLKVASNETRRNIKGWLDEYNKLLSEAKNKLPSMYLDAKDAVKMSFLEFKTRWDAYHRELNKFCDLGILEPVEAMIADGELEKAFKEKEAFMITYLDAFESTLGPLQRNYQKVKLFADIFHKRNEITRKTIKFTPDGIAIFSNGQKIDIDCLSSGEKNDFVMFYRLIFNAIPGGIVLIDEPEISLHIEWQEDYLDKLIDICKINGLQAIVATHSPNIVNDHFDLFVDKR